MQFFSNITEEEVIEFVDIQIALIIVVFVLLTNSLFAKAALSVANKVFKRKKAPKDSKMYRTLKWSYIFLGVYLAIRVLPVSEEVIDFINLIGKIVIVLVVTKFINTAILVPNSVFFKKKNKDDKENSGGMDKDVGGILYRIARIIVWVVALYIIFLMMGLDLGGLVTGLGIGTIIISLAAQDTVKSLLSGLIILSDKPFVIGDWITVGDYAGTVVNISFRSTRIKGNDKSIVTIPNSVITESSVVNWSKLESRRLDYTLNLDMATTSEKIKKVVKEIKTVLCSKNYVIADSVYVGFGSISEYSSDIKIFFNVTETDYRKFLDVKEELNYEFLRILEKEGVELAYPTETVNVKNVDDENSDENNNKDDKKSKEKKNKK